MAKTFDQSLDEIAQRVTYYRTNRAAFHAPGYKEAHARQNLIDPLFIALDWDVYNAERAAPQYQPVVLEDSLETETGKKAPDYAFRIGRDPAFFAEAKKPAESIKTNPDHAYQLRRYAWSAKLPLSILTDFEELAVYDCRTRPSDRDKVSAGRISYLTFEEYPDRWRELWDVFSYGAVRSGSFDQYAQTAKGKRGTSEVDAEFLKEIERWRDVLARNIALRNPRLSIDELNDAVQRTIDRLIFLRMAEDRGIEPYGKLLALTPAPSAASPVGKASTGEGSVYAGLIDLCRAADAKYNSGLFDFSPRGDALALKLKVDDSVLKPILAGLYYPQSPYEFSVLPAEILGSVYEQFLGKVIRLTPSHHAKVEEKPEVKKAGGVYYTPAYIVEYIVKNTVGKLIEGKAPKQLEGFRVLDMACGSGSFLLGAYQHLLDYYLRWYVEHNPEKHAKAVWRPPLSSPPQSRGDRGWEWRLTTAEKKRILTTHIFGVDIDRQAVEVTKLSLLLKVLEGESDETLDKQLALFPERALPNLDANIKCGNSLIGPDYFSGQLMPDTEELKRVNVFDWEREFPEVFNRKGAKDAKGGFDCVIGNPPYVLLQDAFRDPRQLTYFRATYTVSSFKLDTYHLFVEKGIRLTTSNGRCAMITPANFMTNNHLAGLRRFMLENSTLDHILVIDGGVFEGGKVDNAIFVVISGKPKSQSFNVIHVSPTGNTLVEDARNSVSVGAVLRDKYALFTGSSDASMSELWKRITERNILLGDIAHVNFGKQLRDRKIYTQDVIEVSGPRSVPRTHKLCYTGRDVSRYLLRWGRLACLDSTEAQSGGCWDDDKQNAKNKLVTRQIGRYPEFAIDTLGYQCLNTMFMVNVHSAGYDTRFLLGVLDSKLMQAFWLDRFYDQRRTFPKIKGTYLKQLPICSVNTTDPADKGRYDRMVTLVEQMLDLHKRLAAASAAEREVLQRQIDATDRQIDHLVYELYGLTEDEIRIVEGG